MINSSPAGRSIALVSHIDLNLARFRRTLMQLLVEEGWRVHAVVPRGPYAGELELLGVELLDYPTSRMAHGPGHGLGRGLRRHWHARAALTRLFRARRFDLVHSFTHLPNLLCRLALPLRHRPVLVNSVTGLGSGFLRPGLKGTALRLAMHQAYASTARRCEAVLFQNEDDRNYFTLHGLTGRAATQVVPGSGVDLTRFRPNLFSDAERQARRASLSIAPHHVLAVMASRLLFDKGIRETMLAAQALARTTPALRLVVAGGPDPGNPCSLSEADTRTFAALGNVLFVGWQEDMERLWNLAEFAVLPSYREGLPVSMQEALACGLPVVVTDVPGCREIARPTIEEAALGKSVGEHALLIPAGQWPPLAEAMRLLTETPSLRLSMATAARRKAEEAFDARVLARQTVAIYEALLQGAHGRRILAD
ncbi:glycosyltransferase [Megalodesulfovibrio paquesii]